MAALLKGFAFSLALGAVLTISAAQAEPVEDYPEVSFVEFMEAVDPCFGLVLPEADQTFREVVQSADWTFDEETGVYRHNSLPTAITLPDVDTPSVARSCEALGMLETPRQAEELVIGITVLIDTGWAEKEGHLVSELGAPFGTPDIYRVLKIFQDEDRPRMLRIVSIVE